MLPLEFQSISHLATHADWLLFISSLLEVTSCNSAAKIFSQTSLSVLIDRDEPNSFFLDSSATESDVFYVERSSEEGSPIRSKSPAILNLTELSGAMARETIPICSVASPEPRIVTIDSDSNEPTIQCRLGSQRPTVPPSLKNLNLPPNPWMSWRRWLLFERTKTIAPSQWSHPSRLQFRRS